MVAKEKDIASQVQHQPGAMRQSANFLNIGLLTAYRPLTAAHRKNRTKPATQDRRLLRRYKRRSTVERLFTWLQNYRRILVRYDRHLEYYLGFVQLGCIVILLRRYF